MATPFIVKQGLYANLPTTYTAGTIYVCTDTAEMYIDTTNTAAGRICITNTALEEDLATLNSETIKTIKVNNSNLTVSNNSVSIPTASTSSYGTTKLSSSTTSTSTELAATSSAVKTAYDAAKAITPITKQNITISSWSSNSTYTDFPYRATVSITGVTADMIPEVIFNATDALSGNYAPVSQTYAGGVYIYSKVTTSITVPTIICYPRGTVVS